VHLVHNFNPFQVCSIERQQSTMPVQLRFCTLTVGDATIEVHT